LARQFRKDPTEAEAFFWGKVRNRQLFGRKFHRQYIIQHGESKSVKKYFIADFFCLEKKLVVELDGEIHQQQIEYDKIREDILFEMGYRVVRFKNEEVLQDWPKVKSDLAKYLG